MEKIFIYDDYSELSAYERENGTALSVAVKNAEKALDESIAALEEHDSEANFKAWKLAQSAFDTAFRARKQAVDKWLGENIERVEFVY